MNFSVTSKKLCCIWKSVQFSTCWGHSMLNFERSALIRKSASSRREVINAHLLAREALMNVRKFDNLRKDIVYPAMSPILHLRFWGNMFSIWCSTCIVRTRVLGVRHWRLQAIGKAPRASMLNTEVSIEWPRRVENWTLFQMQHSFFWRHTKIQCFTEALS